MSEEDLRRHYAATALARLGVPFERGMQIEAVRAVVEAAARVEIERRGEDRKAA